MKSDDKYSAYLRSTEFDDPRVSYYWDRYKLTGAEWKEVLNKADKVDVAVAWDIYFLYNKIDTWGDIPSYPDFFMNQIGLPKDISPHLDSDKLTEKIAEYLKK